MLSSCAILPNDGIYYNIVQYSEGVFCIDMYESQFGGKLLCPPVLPSAHILMEIIDCAGQCVRTVLPRSGI